MASIRNVQKTFRIKSKTFRNLSATILTRRQTLRLYAKRRDKNEPELWTQKFGLHGIDSSCAYSRSSARGRGTGLERDYAIDGRRSAPFPQARFAAITQLAVFEAVNATRSNTGHIRHRLIMAPQAHRLRPRRWPRHTWSSRLLSGCRRDVGRFARASSLATIPDGAAKKRGDRVWERRRPRQLWRRGMTVSSLGPRSIFRVVKPGEWQTTAGCTAAGGALSRWRNVKPFGLRSSAQFQLDGHRRSGAPDTQGITTRSSPWARQTAHPAAGSDRRCALLCAVSPTAVWNPVARQISIAEGNSLVENARAFALLNIAMSDAAVTTSTRNTLTHLWRRKRRFLWPKSDRTPATGADPSFRLCCIHPLLSRVSVRARHAEQCRA